MYIKDRSKSSDSMTHSFRLTLEGVRRPLNPLFQVVLLTPNVVCVLIRGYSTKDGFNVPVLSISHAKIKRFYFDLK